MNKYLIIVLSTLIIAFTVEIFIQTYFEIIGLGIIFLIGVMMMFYYYTINEIYKGEIQ